MTDDDGVTRSVTVAANPPPNAPPTAGFTVSCTGLFCDFDGVGSTDPDGTIDRYAWEFGDGAGTSGSDPTASHDYASDGTYTVTLVVRDDDGASDTSAQRVTVSSPATDDGTMHVGDLDGASTNEGSTWTAVVTIRVHDGSHDGVSGVLLSGSWSNGASGSASCTTAADGSCQASAGGIRKRVPSVTFEVLSLSGSLAHDADDDHDPDGDSTGTFVTVSKP